MEAKCEIINALENHSSTIWETYSTALACVKDHKMSKDSLCKIKSELARREITQDTTGKKVESIVTELVKDAFSRINDHSKEGTRDGKREGEAQYVQIK